MSMFQLTHPDDLELTKQASANFTDDHFIMRRFEKRYVTKKGDVVWGLVTSQHYDSPVTGKRNLLTVVEDITELKKRELEVKQAELDIAHFFAASLDLMCVATSSGYLKKVNPALVSTMGFSEEELTARPFLEFTHADDRSAVRLELEKLAKGIPTLKFESRWITKKGEYRLLSWIAAPDTATGLIYASARDVTEIRQAESKLAYSSKMASLGEMAGGIAHEINNPLAIILGMTTNIKTLLSRPDLDLDLVEEEIKGIELTGLRIAKIVRGLRAFSRQGESDPMNTVPLTQIIDDTLELCAQRISDRNIELSISCPPDLKVSCRPSQLSQVLMNLISNATDANEGKLQSWIKIHAEKTDTTIELSVEDSGTGISLPVQEKMMQPFFTTKEVGKGTGLGLSISKGIVEDHGGHLRYDDSSGHTRFVVELPLG